MYESKKGVLSKLLERLDKKFIFRFNCKMSTKIQPFIKLVHSMGFLCLEKQQAQPFMRLSTDWPFSKQGINEKWFCGDEELRRIILQRHCNYLTNIDFQLAKDDRNEQKFINIIAQIKTLQKSQDILNVFYAFILLGNARNNFRILAEIQFSPTIFFRWCRILKINPSTEIIQIILDLNLLSHRELIDMIIHKDSKLLYNLDVSKQVGVEYDTELNKSENEVKESNKQRISQGSSLRMSKAQENNQDLESLQGPIKNTIKRISSPLKNSSQANVKRIDNSAEQGSSKISGVPISQAAAAIDASYEANDKEQVDPQEKKRIILNIKELQEVCQTMKFNNFDKRYEWANLFVNHIEQIHISEQNLCYIFSQKWIDLWDKLQSKSRLGQALLVQLERREGIKIGSRDRSGNDSIVPKDYFKKSIEIITSNPSESIRKQHQIASLITACFRLNKPKWSNKLLTAINVQPQEFFSLLRFHQLDATKFKPFLQTVFKPQPFTNDMPQLPTPQEVLSRLERNEQWVQIREWLFRMVDGEQKSKVAHSIFMRYASILISTFEHPFSPHTKEIKRTFESLETPSSCKKSETMSAKIDSIYEKLKVRLSKSKQFNIFSKEKAGPSQKEKVLSVITDKTTVNSKFMFSLPKNRKNFSSQPVSFGFNIFQVEQLLETCVDILHRDEFYFLSSKLAPPVQQPQVVQEPQRAAPDVKQVLAVSGKPSGIQSISAASAVSGRPGGLDLATDSIESNQNASAKPSRFSKFEDNEENEEVSKKPAFRQQKSIEVSSQKVDQKKQDLQANQVIAEKIPSLQELDDVWDQQEEESSFMTLMFKYILQKPERLVSVGQKAKNVVFTYILHLFSDRKIRLNKKYADVLDYLATKLIIREYIDENQAQVLLQKVCSLLPHANNTLLIVQLVKICGKGRIYRWIAKHASNLNLFLASSTLIDLKNWMQDRPENEGRSHPFYTFVLLNLVRQTLKARSVKVPSLPTKQQSSASAQNPATAEIINLDLAQIITKEDMQLPFINNSTFAEYLLSKGLLYQNDTIDDRLIEAIKGNSSSLLFAVQSQSFPYVKAVMSKYFQGKKILEETFLAENDFYAEMIRKRMQEDFVEKIISSYYRRNGSSSLELMKLAIQNGMQKVFFILAKSESDRKELKKILEEGYPFLKTLKQYDLINFAILELDIQPKNPKKGSLNQAGAKPSKGESFLVGADQSGQSRAAKNTSQFARFGDDDDNQEEEKDSGEAPQNQLAMKIEYESAESNEDSNEYESNWLSWDLLCSEYSTIEKKDSTRKMFANLKQLIIDKSNGSIYRKDNILQPYLDLASLVFERYSSQKNYINENCIVQSEILRSHQFENQPLLSKQKIVGGGSLLNKAYQLIYWFKYRMNYSSLTFDKKEDEIFVAKVREIVVKYGPFISQETMPSPIEPMDDAKLLKQYLVKMDVHNNENDMFQLASILNPTGNSFALFIFEVAIYNSHLFLRLLPRLLTSLSESQIEELLVSLIQKDGKRPPIFPRNQKSQQVAQVAKVSATPTSTLPAAMSNVLASVSDAPALISKSSASVLDAPVLISKNSAVSVSGAPAIEEDGLENAESGAQVPDVVLSGFASRSLSARDAVVESLPGSIEAIPTAIASQKVPQPPAQVGSASLDSAQKKNEMFEFLKDRISQLEQSLSIEVANAFVILIKAFDSTYYLKALCDNYDESPNENTLNIGYIVKIVRQLDETIQTNCIKRLIRKVGINLRNCTDIRTFEQIAIFYQEQIKPLMLPPFNVKKVEITIGPQNKYLYFSSQNMMLTLNSIRLDEFEAFKYKEFEMKDTQLINPFNEESTKTQEKSKVSQKKGKRQNQANESMNISAIQSESGKLDMIDSIQSQQMLPDKSVDISFQETIKEPVEVDAQSQLSFRWKVSSKSFMNSRSKTERASKYFSDRFSDEIRHSQEALRSWFSQFSQDEKEQSLDGTKKWTSKFEILLVAKETTQADYLKMIQPSERVKNIVNIRNSKKMRESYDVFFFFEGVKDHIFNSFVEWNITFEKIMSLSLDSIPHSQVYYSSSSTPKNVLTGGLDFALRYEISPDDFDGDNKKISQARFYCEKVLKWEVLNETSPAFVSEHSLKEAVFVCKMGKEENVQAFQTKEGADETRFILCFDFEQNPVRVSNALFMSLRKNMPVIFKFKFNLNKNIRYQLEPRVAIDFDSYLNIVTLSCAQLKVFVSKIPDQITKVIQLIRANALKHGYRHLLFSFVSTSQPFSLKADCLPDKTDKLMRFGQTSYEVIRLLEDNDSSKFNLRVALLRVTLSISFKSPIKESTNMDKKEGDIESYFSKVTNEYELLRTTTSQKDIMNILSKSWPMQMKTFIASDPSAITTKIFDSNLMKDDAVTAYRNAFERLANMEKYFLFNWEQDIFTYQQGQKDSEYEENIMKSISNQSVQYTSFSGVCNKMKKSEELQKSKEEYLKTPLNEWSELIQKKNKAYSYGFESDNTFYVKFSQLESIITLANTHIIEFNRKIDQLIPPDIEKTYKSEEKWTETQWNMLIECCDGINDIIKLTNFKPKKEQKMEIKKGDLKRNNYGDMEGNQLNLKDYLRVVNFSFIIESDKEKQQQQKLLKQSQQSILRVNLKSEMLNFDILQLTSGLRQQSTLNVLRLIVQEQMNFYYGVQFIPATEQNKQKILKIFVKQNEFSIKLKKKVVDMNIYELTQTYLLIKFGFHYQNISHLLQKPIKLIFQHGIKRLSIVETPTEFKIKMAQFSLLTVHQILLEDDSRLNPLCGPLQIRSVVPLKKELLSEIFSKYNWRLEVVADEQGKRKNLQVKSLEVTDDGKINFIPEDPQIKPTITKFFYQNELYSVYIQQQSEKVPTSIIPPQVSVAPVKASGANRKPSFTIPKQSGRLSMPQESVPLAKESVPLPKQSVPQSKASVPLRKSSVSLLKANIIPSEEKGPKEDFDLNRISSPVRGPDAKQAALLLANKRK